MVVVVLIDRGGLGLSKHDLGINNRCERGQRDEVKRSRLRSDAVVPPVERESEKEDRE